MYRRQIVRQLFGLPHSPQLAWLQLCNSWLDIASLVGLYDVQLVPWVVRQLVRECTAGWIVRQLVRWVVGQLVRVYRCQIVGQLLGLSHSPQLVRLQLCDSWLEIASLVGLYDVQLVRWVVRQLVRDCTAGWIVRCLAGSMGCTTAGERLYRWLNSTTAGSMDCTTAG